MAKKPKPAPSIASQVKVQFGPTKRPPGSMLKGGAKINPKAKGA